ncbi:predicted protein [Nematostella vectensis]|uniref:Uncharacterized protein n=1 Tax=Nematostella vectensis TaxID=45351 RepID=A7RMY7_NEMVE|nr:predicted protein [Nematostella vectensis]|eukprot:XP_001639295.1 predicted protein [Nematostella vectensis]
MGRSSDAVRNTSWWKTQDKAILPFGAANRENLTLRSSKDNQTRDVSTFSRRKLPRKYCQRAKAAECYSLNELRFSG